MVLALAEAVALQAVLLDFLHALSCENTSVKGFARLRASTFSKKHGRDENSLDSESDSENNRESRPLQFRLSRAVCRRNEKPEPYIAHINLRRPLGLRSLLVEAKVRLCFSLAINHSILQESLPTVITANKEKVTLVVKIASIYPASVSITLLLALMEGGLPVSHLLTNALDARKSQTVDG